MKRVTGMKSMICRKCSEKHSALNTANLCHYMYSEICKMVTLSNWVEYDGFALHVTNVSWCLSLHLMHIHDKIATVSAAAHFRRYLEQHLVMVMSHDLTS